MKRDPQGSGRLAWRGSLWASLAVLGLGLASAAGAEGPATPPSGKKPLDYRQAIQRARQRSLRAENLETVQRAVRAFQMRFGRVPIDLKELVSRGVLAQLPPPPADMIYAYQQMTGTVRLISAPDSLAVEGATPPAGTLPPNP